MSALLNLTKKPAPAKEADGGGTGAGGGAGAGGAATGGAGGGASWARRTGAGFHLGASGNAGGPAPDAMAYPVVNAATTTPHAICLMPSLLSRFVIVIFIVS